MIISGPENLVKLLQDDDADGQADDHDNDDNDDERNVGPPGSPAAHAQPPVTLAPVIADVFTTLFVRGHFTVGPSTVGMGVTKVLPANAGVGVFTLFFPKRREGVKKNDDF